MKTSSPTNSNPRFDQHKGRFKQPLSSSALYAGSEECTLQCVFCKKNHKSITCSTITEPKARRTILRRSGRCFVFLKAGHITPGCQSKAKCFNCGARHHMTIRENPKKPVQPSSSGAESRSITYSPVILWKKIGQPATNCNRRFFNGFRLCNVSLLTYQKSQKIPLREVTKKRNLL